MDYWGAKMEIETFIPKNMITEFLQPGQDQKAAKGNEGDPDAPFHEKRVLVGLWFLPVCPFTSVGHILNLHSLF